MYILRSGIKIFVSVMVLTALIGCVEIGSERWCNNMKEKPKGDWTANEATDFAKHCLF